MRLQEIELAFCLTLLLNGEGTREQEKKRTREEEIKRSRDQESKNNCSKYQQTIAAVSF